jgi:tetratricopeptide (TPR) repeat protein
MAIRDDKPKLPNDDGGWKDKKHRDDTPSFIRNVQARAELLNPNRSSSENIPVLAMPASVRIWRKVRWPLFIAIVLTLLAIIGVFTKNRLVDRSVKKEIADAADAEAAASIDGLLSAHRTLTALAERHPGRQNAQVAHAWHAVLLGELFGPVDVYLGSASASLGRIDSDATALGFAARAGAAHLRGDDAGALEIAQSGLKAYPKDARISLVAVWALRALGRAPEAKSAYEALRNEAPQYLPALQIALLNAIDDGDNAVAKQYATELMTSSSSDLIGALGSIAVRLPDWYDDADPSQASAALEDMTTLKAHFADAPPRVFALGYYLLGRVDLNADKVADAAANLKAALGKRPSDRLAAWTALAVRREEGPRAAIQLIGAADPKRSPEMASLGARCHLDLHHVETAATSVAALEASGAPDSGELAWILAVRRGDSARAKETLPATIDARLEWVGLEMHDLLREAGDVEGIAALADRFENAACGNAIRAWHTDDTDRLFATFESEEGRKVPCVAALTARLMRGHLSPAAVKEAADTAVAASEGDLRTRVDQALAVWLTDGQAAASKALDGVAAAKPEDGALLGTLAEAYLAIGIPKRAAEISATCKSAVCTGARIAASKRTGDAARAVAELDAAIASPAIAQAPAIVEATMARELESQKLEAVVFAADEALPTAGRWSAEIAALKAAALGAMDKRADGDRALLATADRVVDGVGIDESWEAKLAMVRSNLDRGGKFSFKAFGVAFEMYKAGVKDAELSYSYAVANIEQGNERGALRYLKEAIELDPSFVPAYTRLKLLGKLPDDLAARLERVLPGAQP